MASCGGAAPRHNWPYSSIGVRMRAYSAIQCDSQATAQVRNAHRALCGGCFPRAQAKELWRGWMEPGWKSRVRTGEHRARAGMCLRTPRTAFCPVGPAWRCPQNDARRDLGGRARGAATAVGAAVELRHRQAVRAARMPRPEGAQSESDREGSREATAPVSFLLSQRRCRKQNYRKKARKKLQQAATG